MTAKLRREVRSKTSADRPFARGSGSIMSSLSRSETSRNVLVPRLGTVLYGNTKNRLLLTTKLSRRRAWALVQPTCLPAGRSTFLVVSSAWPRH